MPRIGGAGFRLRNLAPSKLRKISLRGAPPIESGESLQPESLSGTFFRRFPNVNSLFPTAGSQYGPLARVQHLLDPTWKSVVQPLASPYLNEGCEFYHATVAGANNNLAQDLDLPTTPNGFVIHWFALRLVSTQVEAGSLQLLQSGSADTWNRWSGGSLRINCAAGWYPGLPLPGGNLFRMSLGGTAGIRVPSLVGFGFIQPASLARMDDLLTLFNSFILKIT